MGRNATPRAAIERAWAEAEKKGKRAGWAMFKTLRRSLMGGVGGQESRRRDRRFRPAGMGLEGLEGRRVPSGIGIFVGGTPTNSDGFVFSAPVQTMTSDR